VSIVGDGSTSFASALFYDAEALRADEPKAKSVAIEPWIEWQLLERVVTSDALA
jgi:hypothetical protein